jgi:predicted GIY-YIG superfamily endonuclease
MPYFVYVIQSQVDGTCYKGYSEDPQLPRERHNRGESAEDTVLRLNDLP